MKLDSEKKTLIEMVAIILFFVALITHSFYLHRNDPGWNTVRQVKIVK